MTKDLHDLAHRLQDLLRAAPSMDQAPRGAVDGWAALYGWHRAGERWWRISEEHAERLLDEPLPADLQLAMAPTRGEGMAYQLPDRQDWIVLARWQPQEIIPVWGERTVAYRQPVLVYATAAADGTLLSGYVSLIDQPTPPDVHLRPGVSLLRGPLTDAEITEEDYRLSLAIAQHYRP